MSTHRYARLFSGVQETTWLVLVAYGVYHTAVLYTVFVGWPAAEGAVARVERWSNGLVTPLLLVYALEFSVLIGGVVLLSGRLRLRDIGLDLSGLVNGFIVLVLLWVLVQTAVLVWGAVSLNPIALNPLLAPGTVGLWIGRSVQELFGIAFVEEVSYRGFLLPQLYRKSAQFIPNGRIRLVASVAVTSLFFGLNHIPAGVHRGMANEQLIWYVVQATLVGIFFAAVYLRTGNLYIAIGMHALLNFTPLIAVSTVHPAFPVLVISVALLLAWPKMHARLNEVFTLTPLWRGSGSE